MKAIHKFTLLTSHWCETLQIPKGAKFLGFDFQHRNPTMWFEVETMEPMEPRSFEVVGTCMEVPDGGMHLASKQVLDDGMYWVWHLYEVIK